MENIIDMVPAKNGAAILEWVIPCHLWGRAPSEPDYRQSSLCMVVQDCQDDYASQTFTR